MPDHVLFMALLDMIVHPVLEGLAKPCIDDVGYPLPRKQMELLLVREVVHQIRVLACLREHALHGDVLVLGTVDLSMLVRFDT